MSKRTTFSLNMTEELKVILDKLVYLSDTDLSKGAYLAQLVYLEALKTISPDEFDLADEYMNGKFSIPDDKLISLLDDLCINKDRKLEENTNQLLNLFKKQKGDEK